MWDAKHLLSTWQELLQLRWFNVFQVVALAPVFLMDLSLVALVESVQSPCHVEIYMTINATEACVKVITVARPAMSALVFLFLCRAASWPPRLSNTTCTESRTMDHEPHSRISVHMDGQEAAAPDKHRIQGGNARKTTKKEAQEQRV